MSFFEELNKRHVFKVGDTYAIVAWLLVQAADVFFPALHVPDWATTLVAGLVLLGFPVALLLAWAYEMTPGGIVTTAEAQASASFTPECLRIFVISSLAALYKVIFLGSSI